MFDASEGALPTELGGRDRDTAHADSDGRTLLHQAIDSHNDPEVIAVLIAQGTDVDRRDRWGNTPLWLAVYHLPATLATIRLLLGAGADPALANNGDVSPIDLARRMAADFPEAHEALLMLTGTGR